MCLTPAGGTNPVGPQESKNLRFIYTIKATKYIQLLKAKIFFN